MKINLGCGTNFLPLPWKNYDKEVDITKRLPWNDNSVEFILIEHCLEHVSGPDAFRFMEEAYRVLKVEGILRVCVPQLKNLTIHKRKDIILNHGHLMVYDEINLIQMLTTAGFIYAVQTERRGWDGHWKVIGDNADYLETLRVEAKK